MTAMYPVEWTGERSTLKGLKISEVSLVDVPCNGGARVLLARRHEPETERENPMSASAHELVEKLAAGLALHPVAGIAVRKALPELAYLERAEELRGVGREQSEGPVPDEDAAVVNAIEAGCVEAVAANGAGARAPSKSRPGAARTRRGTPVRRQACLVMLPVEVEFSGRARQLCRDVLAAGRSRRDAIAAALAPLQRQLERRPTMRAETIAGMARSWRLTMPTANRVSLAARCATAARPFARSVFWAAT
jgi:hypothetical protein